MDPITTGGLVTAIGGMAATTKTIMETIKLAKAKTKSPEAEKNLSDALDQILSLQTGMIDLQAKILRLQEENSQLREQIRKEEERSKDRGQYQRKQVGKSTVLVREGEPDTYYCTTCASSKGHYVPIQPHPMRTGPFGSHYCSQCKTSYRLE